MRLLNFLSLDVKSKFKFIVCKQSNLLACQIFLYLGEDILNQ